MMASPYAQACAFFRSASVRLGKRALSAGFRSVSHAASIIAWCDITEYALVRGGQTSDNVIASATTVFAAREIIFEGSSSRAASKLSTRERKESYVQIEGHCTRSVPLFCLRNDGTS